MAITYSTNLRLTLIGTGDQAGTWGNTTNTNLGTLIEQAIAGFVSQTVSDSAGSPTSLTISDGTSSVARNMIIALDGALSAPRDVILPTNKKLYFVHNNTTGGHAVTVKCAGQTGVAVPAGAKTLLVCNGTDIIDAANYFSTFIFPSSATITTLTGTTLGYASASLTTASIASGNISNLIATNAGFGSASITTVTGTTIGTVASSTIQGASGVITQFNAASATITTLTATSSTITTLKSTSATIDNLNVTSLTTANFPLPTSGTIATLSGTTLGYGSASITNLSSGSGTVSGNFNMATASGNVGIGTTSPWEKLSIPFNAGFALGSSAYSFKIQRSSSGELVTTFSDTYDATTARVDFTMRAGSGAQNTPLSILGSGNVGIGTTSPESIFQVLSRFRVQGDGVVRWGSSVSSSAYNESGYLSWNTGKVRIGYEGSGALAFGNSSVGDTMLLNASGNLAMTGGGSVDAASFRDYSNTAYYLDPANTGTAMVVAGSITAGRTEASYKLDVLSPAFTVARFQSTFTSGNTNYSSILIGGQSTAAGASVGWAQDAVTPANSFFHITPYAQTEGGVFCISQNNRVGIGYSTPEYKLDVNGEARFFGATGGGNGGAFRVYNTSAGATNPNKYFVVNSIGSWQIINSAGSAVTHQFDDNGSFVSLGGINAPAFYDKNNTAYYLDPANTGTSLNVAGSVVAAGNVTAYSDIRVKANIEPIHGALDKISQINGVTYTRTDLDDKERRYGGVIAQEIEAVLPEAVFDNGEKKAVDYNATIGLLIEAVKEQQAQILELKLEIQQLKGN